MGPLNKGDPDKVVYFDSAQPRTSVTHRTRYELQLIKQVRPTWINTPHFFSSQVQLFQTSIFGVDPPADERVSPRQLLLSSLANSGPVNSSQVSSFKAAAAAV